MRNASLLIQIPLRVLSVMYGAITSFRNYLYDRGALASYVSALPVVSVGNLTVGGNGKTPLCLYLVEALKERGLHPVILSRGYGGSLKGPHLVQLDDSPARVGDEPLLMAQTGGVPVVIACARASGARFIEREKLGDVIILDDGFQHRKLSRQVDIISIFVGSDTAVEAFQAGELLPFGRFREDRDKGLRRATFCVASYRRVISAGEEMPAVDERILSLIPSGVPVFRAAYEWIGVRSLKDGALIAPQRVHAFAGIANPEGFFSSLAQTGFEVDKRFEFPDHHAFSEEEVSKLVEAHPGTRFVCTEKDGVKIRSMSDRITSAFAEFQVRLKVVPSDAFIVAILRSIQQG
jgi:tetraacyldisaccharide 4'-kinase